MPLLTAPAWAEILAHCQTDWPKEACGVVLIAPDDAQQVERVQNIADALHAKYPRRFPSPAEEAYIMAPRDLARLELLRRRGHRVHAIYHAHTRREGAKLSADDVAGALLPDGQTPAHPDAAQIVVSLDGFGPTEANAYRWDPDQRRFRCCAAARFSRQTGNVLHQDPGRELIAPAIVAAKPEWWIETPSA